ncbi:MAG TPA: acyltransferase, partial [Candidatus Janibacter merdipullorum]|nr:acyltransferase [Candidatus Janibacter merdipullorum]
KRLQAWLQRPAAWKATITVNARIMTLYLWHMTAMMLLIWASYALDGWGLDIAPASGDWWATRPVWFAVCAVATAALIAVFGRLEDPSVDLRPAPSTWRPVIATIAVCGGLAVMAKSGIVSDAGVHWVWPALPVAALLLLRMIPLRALMPRP